MNSVRDSLGGPFAFANDINQAKPRSPRMAPLQYRVQTSFGTLGDGMYVVAMTWPRHPTLPTSFLRAAINFTILHWGFFPSPFFHPRYTTQASLGLFILHFARVSVINCSIP